MDDVTEQELLDELDEQYLPHDEMKRNTSIQTPSSGPSFIGICLRCIPPIVYWVAGAGVILFIAGLILRFVFPRYFIPLKTPYTLPSLYRDSSGMWKTKDDVTDHRKPKTSTLQLS